MPTKKRGRPSKVKEKEFSITLQVGDYTAQGTGASMYEALMSIPKPMKIAMKGVVTLSNGTKSRTLVYTPFQICLLYTSDAADE